MNVVVGIGSAFAGLAYDTICDRCGHCSCTLAGLGLACLSCGHGTMRIRRESDIYPRSER